MVWQTGVNRGTIDDLIKFQITTTRSSRCLNRLTSNSRSQSLLRLFITSSRANCRRTTRICSLNFLWIYFEWFTWRNRRFMTCKYQDEWTQCSSKLYFGFRFTKDSSSEETLELQRDETLLGAAVLVTMMKILRFPDRTQNKVFDRIVSELGEDSFNQHLNQLAAIIFNFVKPESGVVQHSKEGVVKAVNKGALQTDRNC